MIEGVQKRSKIWGLGDLVIWSFETGKRDRIESARDRASYAKEAKAQNDGSEQSRVQSSDTCKELFRLKPTCIYGLVEASIVVLMKSANIYFARLIWVLVWPLLHERIDWVVIAGYETCTGNYVVACILATLKYHLCYACLGGIHEIAPDTLVDNVKDDRNFFPNQLKYVSMDVPDRMYRDISCKKFRIFSRWKASTCLRAVPVKDVHIVVTTE